MKIDATSLVLSEGEYYAEYSGKRQIVIHHTVGGSAKSTFDWWKMDPARIGTAFIIDRDGLVYQTFDPEYWAHHLGLKSKDNEALNKASIGIELASEGPLTLRDGIFYAYDGKRRFQGRDLVKFDPPWRGQSYMDAYDMSQILSCFELVEYLCREYKIEYKVLPESRRFKALEENKNWRGVIGHCDVRPDKTDPHPYFPWAELERFLMTLELIPERLTLFNYKII